MNCALWVGVRSGPDWDFRVDYLVGAAARVGAGLARVGVGWGVRRGAEGGEGGALDRGGIGGGS